MINEVNDIAESKISENESSLESDCNRYRGNRKKIEQRKVIMQSDENRRWYDGSLDHDIGIAIRRKFFENRRSAIQMQKNKAAV